jgi:NAD(P)-dependent dehydrogenase (short-subunit alcohol dehydrogenase family)
MQFNGKVAIITGGSLGIGLAMSKAFAAEGADLLVVSNDKTQFENVKK